MTKDSNQQWNMQTTHLQAYLPVKPQAGCLHFSQMDVESEVIVWTELKRQAECVFNFNDFGFLSINTIKMIYIYSI